MGDDETTMTNRNPPSGPRISWQAPVANPAALPLVGNVAGDARVTLNNQDLWVWNGTVWVDKSGSTPAAGLPQSFIVWAPGLTGSVPPVYNAWNDVEAAINALQGACRLCVDQTGLSGFTQVPATAALDGKGRLEIVGGGPNGEAELEFADGGQIKNIREMRTIVVRASPTIRSPIVWDLNGLIVDLFDATFLFKDATATLPVIQASAVNGYLGIYAFASSELRNSHNPGKPVLDISAGATVLLAINELDFASSFNDTISGPVGSNIDLQIDSTVPPNIVLSLFNGTITVTQIATAIGNKYTPAVPANWVGTPPSNVQEALDRIAALVGPIP